MLCINSRVFCIRMRQKTAILATTAVAMASLYILMKRKRDRRWWKRPAFQRQSELSEFEQLVPHLEDNDPEMFFRYLRMTPERFGELLSLVEQDLIKFSQRQSVTPKERLTMTLLFLATGCSQQDLSFRFQRGRSTISSILSETCQVLWDRLSPIYLRLPTTPDEWRQIADGYWQRWNFPNCVGSIDGKHFRIQCPSLSGSTFHNYKGYFSTLVLALCDSNYKFTYVDIGSPGRHGDAGVFQRSVLSHMLENCLAEIPNPDFVPGSDTCLPFVIVGDEAFPLKPYLMRPYPGRSRVVLPYTQQIFNYRLSRARRIIENTFGVLVARWRIFHRPIIANIDNCESYIKAAVVLHNYLMTKDSKSPTDRAFQYIPGDFVDVENTDGSITPGQWRNSSSSEVREISRLGSNMPARRVVEIRDSFADFFVSPTGSVAWQNRMIE